MERSTTAGPRARGRAGGGARPRLPARPPRGVRPCPAPPRPASLVALPCGLLPYSPSPPPGRRAYHRALPGPWRPLGWPVPPRPCGRAAVQAGELDASWAFLQAPRPGCAAGRDGRGRLAGGRHDATA